jgi:hypothetical protein
MRIKTVVVFIFLFFTISSCNNITNIDEIVINTVTKTPLIPTVTPTPTEIISIMKLPGPPEEISKICQVEEFQNYYCPNWQGVSPDKEWAFIDCLEIYDCEKHSHYVMANLDNPNKSWIVRNHEINSRPDYHPLGSWLARAWALDENRVYLVYRDFCEYPIDCQYSTGNSVFLMNMLDQSVSELLPDNIDGYDYELDFSNDSKYLAYSINGTQTLFIRNLITNDETRIPLDPGLVTFGALFWSPNNSYLAFQSGVFDYSYWLLRIKDYRLTNFLEYDENNYYLSGWVDEKTLLLWQINSQNNEQNRYLYNISTNELAVDTTPTPTIKYP